MSCDEASGKYENFEAIYKAEKSYKYGNAIDEEEILEIIEDEFDEVLAEWDKSFDILESTYLIWSEKVSHIDLWCNGRSFI